MVQVAAVRDAPDALASLPLVDVPAVAGRVGDRPVLRLVAEHRDDVGLAAGAVALDADRALAEVVVMGRHHRVHDPEIRELVARAGEHGSVVGDRLRVEDDLRSSTSTRSAPRA